MILFGFVSILSVNWCSQNILKNNLDESYLRKSSQVSETLMVSNLKVESENRINLLRINIDKRLVFDYHVSQFCEMASKKTACTFWCFFRYID